ncbi:MAG: FtsW/RodA/SpoVE family cell cycle protein [Oscillospiraceae bacterium]|nr:FtsW/RodA/SpoVE family cell cycle protein [Oscillospiraceae bacterium]MBR2897295.1 FtsW/RodA/SpoVE family cell cycle protein [Oscillospiraceae bacterium]MBR3849084.1 FtsW/RodA/SpoVE family cell cycle protein [Oscillospiraceae bacterium]
MRLLRAVGVFFKKADMLLLALCLAASLFGVVILSSTTRYMGSGHYILTQLLAIGLGVALYIALTLFDVEILVGQSVPLFAFNMLFISTLFIWGVAGNTGNRSWLAFSWLPFSIQPAEICKITFILINAAIMRNRQRRISEPRTVMKLAAHLIITAGLIILASDDFGVALIYVFVFLLMAFTGGVSKYWFYSGLGLSAIAAPILWFGLFREDQKNRIIALFDPSIDPTGSGVRWQTNLSLRAIRGGGITGQGLYCGDLVQAGANPQQHNDFVFSSIAEELGIVGCVLTLLLLTAIIIRCLYVGAKSGSYLNRQICVGIAGMMIFQVAVNVGMCLGLFPVVGLTLPFISSGGSSLVSTFFAMGIVSGIRMHPSPDSAAAYVRPPSLA